MSDSIRDLFETYAERYMAFDADWVADLCFVPFVAVRAGQAIPLADAAAVRDHFAGVMDAYRAAGAAEAKIVAFDTRPLGSHAVFATVRWHARDADGKVLRDFETTYHLLHGEAGWRMLSYTMHDT